MMERDVLLQAPIPDCPRYEASFNGKRPSEAPDEAISPLLSHRFAGGFGFVGPDVSCTSRSRDRRPIVKVTLVHDYGVAGASESEPSKTIVSVTVGL
jgi:hypothetical protein